MNQYRFFIALLSVLIGGNQFLILCG